MREIGGEGQKWEGDAEKRERERKGEKRVGKGRRGKSPEGGGGWNSKRREKNGVGGGRKEKQYLASIPAISQTKWLHQGIIQNDRRHSFPSTKERKKEAIPILVPNYINSSKTYFILDPSSTATPVLIKTSSVNKWHSRTLHSSPNRFDRLVCLENCIDVWPSGSKRIRDEEQTKNVLSNQTGCIFPPRW